MKRRTTFSKDWKLNKLYILCDGHLAQIELVLPTTQSILNSRCCNAANKLTLTHQEQHHNRNRCNHYRRHQ